MKSLLSRRAVVIALAVSAILAVTVLAAGLDGINFLEPRPFNRAESENISFSVASLVRDLASIPRWKQILFWVGIYLLVLIATSILSPELRKKFLRLTLQFAILSVAILYLVQNSERFGFLDLQKLESGASQGEAPVLDLEPPVFSPPSIPPAVGYLLSVGIVLLGIVIAWTFGRSLRIRRGQPIPDLPLEAIAAAARSSLRDLSEGRGFEDSILRCYERMTNVVARARGYEREQHLTPSEFASTLEAAGLPSFAVHRLTRLFETVRYGARSASTREAGEAAACLREVLHYCGEAPA
jgi:hypothetical protein